MNGSLSLDEELRVKFYGHGAFSATELLPSS